MPGDEAFFAALEAQRTHALVERDLPTLERLHAPHYQLITPAGKVFTRQAYIDAIAAAPFYSAWGITQMSVRSGADMAAVRYLAGLVFPSGRALSCWHTDLYERHEGGWWAVWSQATELKPPAP